MLSETRQPKSPTESREVWYKLVNASNGEPLSGTKVDAISIRPNALMYEVRDAIYKRHPLRLKHIETTDLTIHENESIFEMFDESEERAARSPGSLIGNLGMYEESPIIVVVPSEEYMHGVLSANALRPVPSVENVVAPKFIERFSYSCRWEGSFFELPPEIACSVFNINYRIVLHRRRAVDELYDELKHGDRFLVRGPPGSGKSTTMFAFAISRASEYAEEAILWIVADSKLFFIIGKNFIEKYKIDSSCSWSQLIEQTMADETNKFREIYVDQCRLNHQKASDHASFLQDLVDDWVNKDSSRRLFAITSEMYPDLYGSGFSGADVVQLKPWTLEEYRVVLQNEHAREKFSRSLERSDISADELEYYINLKFYFAGISARFFFDDRISTIRAIVEQSMKKVVSFDNLLKEVIGKSFVGPVNVLIHKVDWTTRFSSRFIVDELLRKKRLSTQTWIVMAERLGFYPNRDALEVLFESYTLTLINLLDWDPLQDVSAAYGPGCPYSIPTTKSDAITIQTVDYMGSNDKVDLEKWYKPFKPSNPGYDAFFAFGKRRNDDGFLEDLVIVFLQVTCGKSHSFYPQHFDMAAVSISKNIKGFVSLPGDVHTRLRDEIKPTHPDYTKIYIEILYAVPSGRKPTFRVDQADNFCEEWFSLNFVVAEVPNSAKFLKDHFSD